MENIMNNDRLNAFDEIIVKEAMKGYLNEMNSLNFMKNVAMHKKRNKKRNKK